MVDTRRSTRVGIHSIPDEILVHKVAEYLNESARALFAVSFRSSHQPLGKKIITTQTSWETLDFGHLDQNLANRLTDADISLVLSCIDAVNTVTTFRLTGCIGIRGWGLQPLKGSKVIETIDLSIVNPGDTSTKPSELHEGTVVPILESMIAAESKGGRTRTRRRCSLKLVLFPKHWRDRKSAVLAEFLAIFDRVLKARRYRCSSDNCNNFCSNYEDFLWQEGSLYGLQNYFCSNCTKQVCEDGIDCSMAYCERCEKAYCDCNPVDTCDLCQEVTCMDCTMIGTCDDCDGVFCMDCRPVFYCDFCEEMSCTDCRVFAPCSTCTKFACSNASCLMMECCEDCKDFTCRYCQSFKTHNDGMESSSCCT